MFSSAHNYLEDRVDTLACVWNPRFAAVRWLVGLCRPSWVCSGWSPTDVWSVKNVDCFRVFCPRICHWRGMVHETFVIGNRFKCVIL